MKFQQYVAFREANETQEIDTIFNKAAADIQGLFKQLLQKTQEMGDAYSQASMPEGMKKIIIQDLNNLIQKVQKTGNSNMPKTSMLDPRHENVMFRTFLKDINENIQLAFNEAETANAPSIIQGVGAHGVGPGGKKAYNFTSVINNIYKMVMDRMHQLKDAVFQHMGILRDTHKRLGGVRNTLGNVRNTLDSMKNPPQPFRGDEADKAQDSMIALADAAKGGFNVKLVGADGHDIAIDPRSTDWRRNVIKMGYRHKLFKLVGPDGKQEEVDISNPDQINQALDALGYSSTGEWEPGGDYLNKIKKTASNKLAVRKPTAANSQWAAPNQEG
jgi:hypothetical protein